ncbi:MAG TPA: hypothetical protein VKE96_22365 [Vicinamibacterales bacterium]|nr:hypothetical protein [Vicinamibacterales bacterium]
MRKEDRVRQQAENEGAKTPDKPQPRPGDQEKGQARPEQPPRKPGDPLPIPD